MRNLPRGGFDIGEPAWADRGCGPVEMTPSRTFSLQDPPNPPYLRAGTDLREDDGVRRHPQPARKRDSAERDDGVGLRISTYQLKKFCLSTSPHPQRMRNGTPAEGRWGWG